MRDIIEQFRNFKKSLLVYFDVPKPTIEIPGGTQNPPEGHKEIGKEFNAKRQEALKVLNKLHLDTELTETSQKEKDLADELEKHINSQFDLLEHNYQEELKKEGRWEENEKAIEARKTLNQAADNFIFQMEMRVLQLSIEKGDEQGKLMAQIRLIDEFTKVPGFGQHFVEGNSGRVEELINSNLKNREEFNKELEKMLDDEKNLENGIWDMIDKNPKFKEVDNMGKVDEAKDEGRKREESDVFDKLIDESERKAEAPDGNPEDSLTYQLGTKQQNILAQTFAKRFYIAFTPNPPYTPDHYVDLMDNNKVYKPDEIGPALLRITKQSNFRSPDALEEYNEEIDDKAEEQTDLYEELLSGLDWVADEEVTGLSTLRNNPQLNKLIATTRQYENFVNKDVAEINEQLAKFSSGLAEADNTDAIKGITSQLTPNYIRENRSLGTASALVELLKLVSMLAGHGTEKKEDTDELGEVAEGLGRKENPVEEVKKSKERYKKNLPDASVTNLLKAYTDPKGEEAKKLFAKNEKGETDGKVDNYPNLALLPAIKDYLKEKLEFTEFLNIKKADEPDTYNFNFKQGDEAKWFVLKITAENKIEITDLGKNNPRTVENNLDAVKAGFEKKAEVSTDKKTEAEKKGTDEIPANTNFIDENHTLRNIKSTTTIQEVLGPEKFSEVVIKIEPERNRAKDQPFVAGTEITVVPGKENNVATFVIATPESHKGKRLKIYNGDTISRVLKVVEPTAETK